jgi:hypothetical protein
MSEFVYKKQVEGYKVISRFGEFHGEPFELRLLHNGEYLAFLNFQHEEGNRHDNFIDRGGVAKFFMPREQYLGVIDLLRNEEPVYFTLYQNPVVGWLSTDADEVPGEGE